MPLLCDDSCAEPVKTTARRLTVLTPGNDMAQILRPLGNDRMCTLLDGFKMWLLDIMLGPREKGTGVIHVPVFR